MKNAIRTTTLIVTCLIAAGAASEEELWTVDDYSHTTADGLELNAWLYTPNADQPAPLIVCLPMLAHTHSTYRLFLDSLENRLAGDSAAEIPAVLTVDMRGHGESTRLSDGTISYQEMKPADFARMPADIVSLTGALLADSQHRTDPDNITVIGASIGANTAIMAAHQIKGVTAVVMLSPGLDYRGLQPAQALDSFDGRCLIYAAADDACSARSVRELGEQNEDCRTDIFPGSRHGTDLINGVPDAMTGMLDFLFRGE